MMEEILTTREVADRWYRDWFAFNEYYSQWAKDHGMNFTIMFCLYAIGRAETQPTPGQLANQLYLSKQTINSALDILESKGYITRSVSPTNRRSRLVTLTEEGRQVTDELLKNMEQLEERVFGVLPPRDRKTLLRLSGRVAQNLKNAVE